MTTVQDGTEKMRVFARRQPLSMLTESLLILDAKPALDEAERLTRAVLIDVICERCPAADAAFNAWAESDDADPRTAVQVITEAANGA